MLFHSLWFKNPFIPSTGIRHHKIAMTRRARYDNEELVGMLSDIDSDDNMAEPMCPGSDNEFPYPDSDGER